MRKKGLCYAQVDSMDNAWMYAVIERHVGRETDYVALPLNQSMNETLYKYKRGIVTRDS